MMINVNTLNEEIQRRFPSFEIDPEFKELPTIIGGDLTNFIAESIGKNQFIDTAIADFINDAVYSAKFDNSIAAFLSEIILGLYDSRYKSSYLSLYAIISKEAQEYFDYSIFLWEKGNGLI